MAEERIKRKQLWGRLGNIKRQRDWLNAAERLGFAINVSAGGTSHTTIRDKKYPVENIRGLVTTIQANLYKQINQHIFKQFMDFGIKEDEIWRALGMLD